MSATNEPHLVIARDFSEVRIHALAGTDPGLVNPLVLAKRLEQTGIEVTDAVRAHLSAFAKHYGKGQAELGAVVARAVPGIRGRDGRVQWSPGIDPHPPHHDAHGAQPTPATTRPGAQHTDHYSGRTYRRVLANTTLGQVVPPTDGTPGTDVRGQPFFTRGNPATLTVDETTVRRDADGALIALIDGLPMLEGGRLSIVSGITLPGGVDFTTGHLDVEGDVVVGQGVRPGFKVKTTGDLTIEGLVEIGELSCGKNLHLRTGMAGGGRGQLHINGDAHVGYLEGVNGTIDGKLTADREIVNCKLQVGGDLDAHNATVLGGEVTVGGSCLLKAIGSEAYRPTTLILGGAPLLERIEAQILQGIAALDAKCAQLAREEDRIRAKPRPSASERERLTEFAYEVAEIQQTRAAKAIEIEKIQSLVQTQRKLDLTIGKIIHPHVRLVIAGATVQFAQAAKGPLTIFWDAHQQLLCRVGTGDPKPLNTIATVIPPPAVQPTPGHDPSVGAARPAPTPGAKAA